MLLHFARGTPMKNIGVVTPRATVRMLPFGNAGGDGAAPGTPPQSIAVSASTPGTLDYNQVVAVVAGLKTKNWARNPFYVRNDGCWYHILKMADGCDDSESVRTHSRVSRGFDG